MGVGGGVAFQAGDPVFGVALRLLWRVIKAGRVATSFIPPSAKLPGFGVSLRRFHLHARPRPFLLNPGIKVGNFMAHHNR